MTANTRRWMAAAGLAIVIASALLWAIREPEPRRQSPSYEPGLSPFHVLAVSAEEEFTAPSPRALSFPADHGAHDAHRTESWTVAGVLHSEGHGPLGVQLTLLRAALRGAEPDHGSEWAAANVYAGLFSISDPVSGGLHTAQRASREALGLAGATGEPRRVWVESWRMEEPERAGEAAELRLRVADDEVELELALRSTKPLIEAGGSFGAASGGAVPVRAYLQPRLRANGALRIGGRRLEVDGIVSIEHAWGELPLPGGPVASDRFTLHLDDGREVFCLRTHRTDGGGRPSAACLLVEGEEATVLSAGQVELAPVEHWRSALTGARYPTSWALSIPAHDLHLELIADRTDQEGVEWLPFWAGPVRATGDTSQRVGGGLVQLYGYGGT